MLTSNGFDDVPRIIGREINTFDACCDRDAVLTAVKTIFFQFVYIKCICITECVFLYD